MKIKEITDEFVLFDNGKKITYEHICDCCEDNYAAFDQLESTAKDYEFKEPLTFEPVQEYGFRFGNKRGRMFFVPCYSAQNGYYSDEVDIYYGGKHVLTATGETVWD